jgi:hypothetical protein
VPTSKSDRAPLTLPLLIGIVRAFSRAMAMAIQSLKAIEPSINQVKAPPPFA